MYRNRIIISLFTLFSILVLKAQMQEPHNWRDYEEVLGLQNGLRHYDYDVTAIYSSAPANVFWPDDKVKFTFQLSSNIDEAITENASIHIIHYGTKGIPNDIWMPQMYKIAEVATIPVKVEMTPNGFQNITIEPEIPLSYGGYAVVFDLGKHGRRLGTSFVRSMAVSSVKMQYPKQSLDDLGVDFLSRIGVQSIRYGISYIATKHRDYQAEMRRFDEIMKQYKDNNITVLLMFGEGSTLIPLGTPRSFLDDQNTFLRTKQDYAWLPSMDEDFKEFVRAICRKHGWPNGPVTAVSLWNEPWEGISISGWQADMLRYREIYKAMAEAVLDVRKEGIDILIGGCDSNSNAWDKLFGDGSMDMLPIFDFLSIHYQGMESPVLYPEWNNRKEHKGRVLIWDTESWVGNTDDRIGLVVATNRAAGYDRSMGIYGGYMYSGDSHVGGGAESVIRTEEGTTRIPKIHTTWSPAAAMGAVQNLIGEREFSRLLFQNGLPWIMLFDGYNGNIDDGTVVVAGDLGEAFGAENILFRGVRSQNEIRQKIELYEKMKQLDENTSQYKDLQREWARYNAIDGGTLRFKAHPSFQAYDSYGNIVEARNGMFEIPLNYRGYYLKTDGSKGSYNRLIKALESAHIEGYEPIDIIAKDFLSPIQEGVEFELELTNILNKEVKGKINVEITGMELQYPDRLKLKPHETKTMKVKVLKGKETPENTYPLQVAFKSDQGEIAMHWENLHVNYISKKTIAVDGDLSDWKGAIGQTIKGSNTASISLTEAAWYPFKNFDTNTEGLATAYLSYDEDNFYFAAKVADKTPTEGTYRFENRNDEEFFYPDTSYQQSVRAMRGKQVKRQADAENIKALQHPDTKQGRTLNTLENIETTQSIGYDLDLPVDSFVQVAIYLPDIDQYNIEIVVSDRNTGKDLASQKIDRLWDGAYAVMDLSGKVRIRCTALGWWYNVKIAGLFFDPSTNNVTRQTAAVMKPIDLDTKGNWKNKYGQYGYAICGLPLSLPENISVTEAIYDDKIPLIWPQGTRRYTYRKDPVLPDASMGQEMDNIMIAFNVIPIGEDGMQEKSKGTMPRFIGYKCTDYEYALNKVAEKHGGGTEIWRMLAPGMVRKHFYPRQPKSPMDGAVKDGQLEIRREGNTLYTECAIPWSEMPLVKEAIDAGKPVKFSFRVNDNGAGGACMELARERSVSKKNSRAFHPDWKEHWANEVEFGVEK